MWLGVRQCISQLENTYQARTASLCILCVSGVRERERQSETFIRSWCVLIPFDVLNGCRQTHKNGKVFTSRLRTVKSCIKSRGLRAIFQVFGAASIQVRLICNVLSLQNP